MATMTEHALPTPPHSPLALEPARGADVLLDSLTAFYQQERYWIHHTRAALEVALAKGSDARAITFGASSPSESPSVSVGSLTPESASSPSASTTSTMDEPSATAALPTVKTEPDMLPDALSASDHSAALAKRITRWNRRKNMMKLKLEGISSTALRRRRPHRAPVSEPGARLLEMFSELVDARMESCQRVSRLVRETHRPQPEFLSLAMRCAAWGGGAIWKQDTESVTHPKECLATRPTAIRSSLSRCGGGRGAPRQVAPSLGRGLARGLANQRGAAARNHATVRLRQIRLYSAEADLGILGEQTTGSQQPLHSSPARHMPAHYAPLPSSHTDPDADHELEAAFDDSDDEDDQQGAPGRTRNGYHELAHDESAASPSDPIAPEPAPGTYNFESTDFDWVRPPPGSPPSPTRALANDYGNSNGVVPVLTDMDGARRGGWFRRTAAAVLPSHYVQQFGLAQEVPRTPVGGGTNNDGVFANVVAKPSRSVVIQEGMWYIRASAAASWCDMFRVSLRSSICRCTGACPLLLLLSSLFLPAGDETFLVPEDAQKDAPPSYAAAQQDAVPPYWETTIHAPTASTEPGEIVIDGLPTGSLFSFLWNMLVSVSFQFVGFMLTYLLHTTHAAKLGSRAGFGITLIQYGFAMRRDSQEAGYGQTTQEAWNRPHFSTPQEAENYYQNLNATAPTTEEPTNADGSNPFFLGDAAAEWISFLLMTIGWFVLLTSLLGFWRVKRWERGILNSQRDNPSERHANGPANGTLIHSLERALGINGLADGSLIRTGFGLERPGAREGDLEAEIAIERIVGPFHDPEERAAHMAERNEYQLPLTDDPEQNARVAQAMAEQARLHHNLRQAGLI
ncbi:uncharacterized protein C8Q71DRAFT_825911 [Rhodofomes roseus]|uniref:Metal homeostatis protein bsd2 n=1 Tax=Rhodofomes roseus TaxID=34475 RepID=A0ABQ8KX28_9APHY|nr:uncharacterized protein C8Q71DRAFT_825911 [Rhodofomes roseus]KAH9843855.1 hypothetical protein C8Q71DRAFT_825911 [Rhodofomes roseus]